MQTWALRLSLNWVEILHSVSANSLDSASQTPSNGHLHFPRMMSIWHRWNELCELDCVCLFVIDLLLMPTKNNGFLALQTWEQDREWNWRDQGKCHLTAHIRALDKQPAGPSPLCSTVSWGCTLFSFEITWVTSAWGSRTKWNERDPWGRIFLEGWVYLESPQNLACHAVISLYFWASKTPSLASVVLRGSQGTQQGGPGMGGEERSF